ncbi:MAG: YicC family protein [Clostridia bacterium]|nr:YicC family protein [Clostridia bacterium]
MKSMTGYGKYSVEKNDRILTIELKTVNNRFLDVSPHMPKIFACCEDIVRKTLKSELSRGNVDVYFDYENNSEKSKQVSVDYALADEFVRAANDVAERYGFASDFNVTKLISLPEVLSVKDGGDDDNILKELVEECIKGACASLNAMREKEGVTIKADLKRLIDNIDGYLQKAITRAPLVVEEYRNKIQTRITEILENVELDEARLLNEVAFFADKADINEEIQRLTSHIKQYNDILESNEPAGRKLDFLSQEINREINTMGSKSNDKELTSYVLAMKNELEKIKEQIRNVE